MNVVGETLAAILEDRGLDLDELERRADLDAGELQEATWLGPDDERSGRLMRRVLEALDVSEVDAHRLRWSFYLDEAPPAEIRS